MVVCLCVRHMARRYASLPAGSVESVHEAMKSLSLEVVSQACFSQSIGLLDPQVGREEAFLIETGGRWWGCGLSPP